MISLSSIFVSILCSSLTVFGTASIFVDGVMIFVGKFARRLMPSGVRTDSGWN